MSINSGLFAGVAAVAAQSTAFAVISDNIANVNTVGFKDSTTQFQALVTQSLSTSASAGGVKARTETNPIKQGLLEGTASNTDIAVDGNGFFVVNEKAVPTLADEYYLTRAGSFVKDEDDRLKNTAGFFLQGYRTDGTGNILNNATRDLFSSLETVDLSRFQRVAKPTAAAELNLNLDSNTATGATADVTNLTVYDSLGNDYLLELSWVKTATPNQWDCTPKLKNTDTTLANSVNPTENAAAKFTVLFNNDGTPNRISSTLAATPTLDAAGATGNPVTANLNFSTANITTGFGAARVVDPVQIVLNLGNFDQPSGVTQYDAPYQTSLLNQDGNGPTDLERVFFDNKGLLTAVFADGSSRPIYRVPLATVPAPNELQGQSGNAYAITADSGEAVLNFATEGGSGRVSANALENSTTDIARQFTDLIIAQRAYSAATKIITTGDELLDEISRVKR